jgi:hypothetical protein
MSVQEKDIEVGLATLARHINAYGQKYWPIFERLESELDDQKNRKARIKSRLG